VYLGRTPFKGKIEHPRASIDATPPYLLIISLILVPDLFSFDLYEVIVYYPVLWRRSCRGGRVSTDA